MQLPLIEDEKEIDTAVRFRAQDQIPMPLDQAVLDHRVVSRGKGPEGDRQMEVIAVAARRDMVVSHLAALRKAGLRPVGIDLSAFGMIRALAAESYEPVQPGDHVDAPDRPAPSREGDPSADQLQAEDVDAAAAVDARPTRLYCNLGDVTNLAVARGAVCLFTRVSPFGVEGIAQKLAERRQLTVEHARQWLVHVGMDKAIEEIEGESETVAAARDALAEGASRLVDELRLSLEYYAAQEDAVAIEGIVACGPGTMIPGLTERLQRDLGQRFEIGRPRALGHLDDATAARLTLSFGLALEE
jgi:type IV pilus assembly protein PilM